MAQLNFTDLHVWKESEKLVVLVYNLTKKFPKEEVFGLTSQLRRASISVTSNIAEGFGRRSLKEKNNFYNISIGSLYEIESQLMASKDIGYVSEIELKNAINQLTSCKKLCYSLISSVRVSIN